MDTHFIKSIPEIIDKTIINVIESTFMLLNVQNSSTKGTKYQITPQKSWSQTRSQNHRFPSLLFSSFLCIFGPIRWRGLTL